MQMRMRYAQKSMWMMWGLLSVQLAAADVLSSNDGRELWGRPVSMNRFAVATFFSDVFNVHGFGMYAFGPLTDFLTYSKNTSEPITFSLRILDLFHARIKEAAWFNAYEAHDMLRVMHECVSPLVHDAFEVRLNQAKKSLYDSLLTRFRDLKTDPDKFIHEVASDMLAVADSSNALALRSLSVRFVEAMVDRLIWSSEGHAEAWTLTKDIANSLYVLYEDKLIPDAATLNHCLWSLVYRLCYEIETAGEEFSLGFYHAIKRDIAAGDALIFAFPDNREGLMISRAQWLRAVVIAGEVRARRTLDGAWVAPIN